MRFSGDCLNGLSMRGDHELKPEGFYILAAFVAQPRPHGKRHGQTRSLEARGGQEQALLPSEFQQAPNILGCPPYRVERTSFNAEYDGVKMRQIVQNQLLSRHVHELSCHHCCLCSCYLHQLCPLALAVAVVLPVMKPHATEEKGVLLHPSVHWLRSAP